MISVSCDDTSPPGLLWCKAFLAALDNPDSIIGVQIPHEENVENMLSCYEAIAHPEWKYWVARGKTITKFEDFSSFRKGVRVFYSDNFEKIPNFSSENIFYGITGHYVDVTTIVYENMVENDVVTIPDNDHRRNLYFDDHLYGIHKHVKIGDYIFSEQVSVSFKTRLTTDIQI